MAIISRQMKRKLIRELSNGKWMVKNWQPMKFDCRLKDMTGLVDTIGIYVNNIYQCIVREHDDYTHLSIRRHDRLPIHNWQHLQQIKKDICGEDREAIELCPDMSRIADTANLYHLWVYR